jgi:hypothetical protein
LTAFILILIASFVIIRHWFAIVIGIGVWVVFMFVVGFIDNSAKVRDLTDRLVTYAYSVETNDGRNYQISFVVQNNSTDKTVTRMMFSCDVINTNTFEGATVQAEAVLTPVKPGKIKVGTTTLFDRYREGVSSCVMRYRFDGGRIRTAYAPPPLSGTAD